MQLSWQGYRLDRKKAIWFREKSFFESQLEVFLVEQIMAFIHWKCLITAKIFFLHICWVILSYGWWNLGRLESDIISRADKKLIDVSNWFALIISRIQQRIFCQKALAKSSTMILIVCTVFNKHFLFSHWQHLRGLVRF